MEEISKKDGELAKVGYSRAELLSKIAKHGYRAVEVLGAACARGDTAAAAKILAKLVPDLKAVDITQMESSQARIVINPRIYIRADSGKKTVKLPDININIKEDREVKRVQEVDITPSLRASPPVVEQVVNYKDRRKQGKFE